MMASLFWQKRPSKKLLAVLLLVVVLMTMTIFRQAIVINSIEHLGRAQNIAVSCLEFSVDWKLNLKIKQACVSSPLGKVSVRDAIWQPWSNILDVAEIKLTHIESSAQIEKTSAPEQSGNIVNLPNALPKLILSKIEIHSAALLRPINLSVSSTSTNEFRIAGDINADIKVSQNTLTATLDWRLSDLTNWLPQIQKIATENHQLLGKLAVDNSKIETRLSFDGKALRANNRFNLDNRISLENCPVDVAFKGNILLEMGLPSFTLNLDISQLENNFVLFECPLLQDYFASNDLPHLSFVIPQNITFNESQINLPQLHIIDKQNPNRKIELEKLVYQLSGELAVNYKIAVAQVLQTKALQAAMIELHTQGDIAIDVTQINSPLAAISKLSNTTNKLQLSGIQLESLNINSVTSQFSFNYQRPNPLKVQAKFSSLGIQLDELKLAKAASELTIAGDNLNSLQLNINSQLLQLTHTLSKAQNINNQMSLIIKDLSSLSFAGNSTFTGISVQDLNFEPITATHSGQFNWPQTTISSKHEISLEQDVLVAIQQQQNQLSLHIAQQELTGLQGIVSQLDNALTVKQGEFNANISFTVPKQAEPFVAQGKLDIQKVSANYQDYELNNISYQTPLTFDSAGLQLQQSSLQIDSIDVGVPIENINAKLIAKDSVLRLLQVHGEIFDGSFSTSQLWLDGRDQQFKVKFQDIDLAEVVALQQQPGIQITGTMDGNLPMSTNQQGMSIDEGWASSLSGGKLTIVDNPSFDSIKEQQPQLALLENLDFTQLESNVKLTPDGWMFFDFSLQGNNPDKKQSVNFNYTHQENLFSLLESIRLVNSVGNNIEQKITQGDKK